jgi:hypothetical protein
MDNSVLWVVALGSGVLGLLLLAVAGAVVVYWNAGARRPREMASADDPQSHDGDIATAEKKRSPASSSNAQPATASSPWLWIKAWLFALFHAGTVSLVLGGITFFEDLAKASEEIQTAGTVTFPKQLLPRTVTGPTSLKRLSQPPGDPPMAEGGADDSEQDQPGPSPPGAAGWEVVDTVQ